MVNPQKSGDPQRDRGGGSSFVSSLSAGVAIHRRRNYANHRRFYPVRARHAVSSQPVPPVPHSSLYEPIDFAAADLLFEPCASSRPGRCVSTCYTDRLTPESSEHQNPHRRPAREPGQLAIPPSGYQPRHGWPTHAHNVGYGTSGQPGKGRSTHDHADSSLRTLPAGSARRG